MVNEHEQPTYQVPPHRSAYRFWFWVLILIHLPFVLFTLFQLLNVGMHIAQGDFVDRFRQYQNWVWLLPTPIGVSGAITLWCNRPSYQTPQTTRLFKRHAIVCLVFLGWFVIAVMDLMLKMAHL